MSDSALPILGDIVLAVLAISVIGALVLYLFWYVERRYGEQKAMPGATPGALNPLLAPPAITLEALAFAVLVLTYPLRLVHDLTPYRAQVRGQTPILLVHGWGANSACFLAVQLWLKWRGYPNVYAVSYTPPIIDARKLAAQLARHIDNARAATGADKVHIVAHSMGGLLTRYAIKNLDCADKIDKVITLGSPHLGSRLADRLPGAGNVPQMRYHSAFLRELADGGLTPGDHVSYYSIYSEFDNFVLPNHSSVLDGDARNIHVPWHGHVALLYSPTVFALVEDCLGEASNGKASTA